MKAYERVAEMLRDFGVDTMFGLLGDANMYVAATFEAAGGRLVRVAHEASAVTMADTYARMTGRLGVATVTHGPGFTNAITALLEAQRFPSSVLLITGDTPPEATHLQRLDMAAMCAVAGIQHEYVHRADSLTRDVNRALRRLQDGPVVLNLPLGIGRATTVSVGRARVPTPRQPRSVEVADLDGALGVVASAARPVVLGGRGVVASGAEEAVAELADQIGAPLLTTGLGHGLFRGHERLLGIMGSLTPDPVVKLLSDADCIVAFGATLNKYTTMGGELVAGKRLVQVDTDAVKLGWLVEPDESVCGDAGDVATQMTEQLREAGVTRSSTWQSAAESVAVGLQSWNPGDRSTDSTIDVRHATRELNRLLPEGAVLVSDVGRFVAGVWPYLDTFEAGSFTAMTGFGAIGLGLAAGTGAAIARPGQPVVLLCGDGGFMMSASELSTAVRERLPLVVLVYNDGAYGAEYMKLVAEGLDPAASYNHWPDLAEIARGFGARAVTVRTVAEIRGLGPIDPSDGPLVVDIRVDPTHHIDF